MIRSETHFDEHISELCKKARRKVCTLSNVTTYVNILEERTFMNNFLHLNLVVALSYGCCGRTNNKKRLHESCLQII